MKSTISKQTSEYLKKIEALEDEGSPMLPYHAHSDAIDQLIIENNLKIEGLSFYPQIDLMLIVLNNKRVLKRNISDFKNLIKASREQLETYELSPMGVHWEALDEDLSLRGFLKHELAFSDNPRIS